MQPSGWTPLPQGGAGTPPPPPGQPANTPAPVSGPPPAPGSPSPQGGQPVPSGPPPGGMTPTPPPPGSGGRGGGRTTALLLGGMAVIAVLLIGGLAISLGFGKGSTEQSPSPSQEAVHPSQPPGQTPAPPPTSSAPAPTATPTSTPAPTPTPVPEAPARYGDTDDQEALRWYVPGAVSPGCSDTDLGAWQAIAAVSCSASGLDSVTYELYDSRTALDADWEIVADQFALRHDAGDCSTGTFEENPWHYDSSPKVVRGRYACGVHDGAPFFAYTDFATLTRVWFYGDAIDAMHKRWQKQSDLDPRHIGSRGAVAALFSKIGDDFDDNCTPTAIAGRQTAAWNCTGVSYVAFANKAAIDADWRNVIKKMGLRLGGGGFCGANQKSENTWHYSSPKGTQGRIACGRYNGSTVVAFTDYSSKIRVILKAASIKKGYATWRNKILYYDN